MVYSPANKHKSSCQPGTRILATPTPEAPSWCPVSPDPDLSTPRPPPAPMHKYLCGLGKGKDADVWISVWPLLFEPLDL